MLGRKVLIVLWKWFDFQENGIKHKDVMKTIFLQVRSTTSYISLAAIYNHRALAHYSLQIISLIVAGLYISITTEIVIGKHYGDHYLNVGSHDRP